jgi:DNA-binding MarR family transcriptional regulator
MTQEETLENYLALVEFLLKSKQQILAIGSELGLSAMQTLTLVLTNVSEPQPMSKFCTMFHCDASNVTGIVDGLEQKKLVSRQGDPHDRRVKVVNLEPAGIATRQEILQRLAQTSSLFANLTQDETKQFVAIIQKITGRKPA